MSAFIDTNVLLYLLPSAHQPKGAVARAILQRPDCVFSVQVLNEFVNQATRTSRIDRIAFDDAIALVDTLRQFPILKLDIALFDLAADVHRRTQYRWWDSLIVAAAITGGCDTLLTEDLQHGRVIDGVRIVNPFRELA